MACGIQALQQTANMLRLPKGKARFARGNHKAGWRRNGRKRHGSIWAGKLQALLHMRIDANATMHAT
jgi:hypothetical protein